MAESEQKESKSEHIAVGHADKAQATDEKAAVSQQNQTDGGAKVASEQDNEREDASSDQDSAMGEEQDELYDASDEERKSNDDKTRKARSNDE